MREEITYIAMQSLSIECNVCGCVWHAGRHGSYGIPVWNGWIVGNDWPYEWGGVPVCRPCYERHERGELTEIHPDEIIPGCD